MKIIRRITAATFFLVLVGTVLAQKPYFVYLQTENQAPFFVQFNKKNISSSSAGHVILSGLTNGDYTIQVGFPGQNATQEYTFSINNEDQGYLVKKFEDDFGILNLQNSRVQLSGSAKKAIAEEERKKALALQEAQRLEEARLAAETADLEKRRLEEEKRIAEEKAALEKANAEKLAVDKATGENESAEAIAIANAAKENAEKAAIEKANKEKADAEKIALEKAAKEKADAEKALTATAATEIEKAGVAKTESAISKTSTASDVGSGRLVVTETAAAPPVKLTPAEIAKLQEEARRIDADGKRDSVLKAQKSTPATASNPAFLDIDFTMPADSTEGEPEKMVVVSEIKQVIADSVPAKMEATVETKEAAKKTENATGIELLKEEPVAVAVATEKPANVVGTDSIKASDSIQAMPAKNPNCQAEATDADIELIAMLMKGEKQPEDALDIARKSMKVKCVSTSQIRKLALIFESQEDRYTLLDMAHRYTSDKHKYAQLSDLLTDPYFLNRFKAMVQ